MGRKKKFKSIENYRSELKRLKDLIGGLLVVIKLFEKLPESPQFKPNADKFKEIVANNSSLDFSKEKIDNIYELGFIRLFASFEAFMYEFIKELYIRYPNSMPTDRKIQIVDILEWKTKKSVKDFIIDHLAIENSYDLITWEKTLKNSFGIEVFENKDIKQAFETLNLCRNMITHSGGKTNSKVMRDFKRIFKDSDDKSSTFKIETMDVFDIKLYNTLVSVTSKIIDNLEKNIA